MDELKEKFEKEREASELSDRKDKALDFLFSQAASFEESKHKVRARLLKGSYFLLGALTLTTISLALAIVIMMPLKQTEPILVKTYKDGYAEVIRDFSEPLNFEKEVDEYFLREYVTKRETYDWFKIQYLVDYTKAWSAPHVYSEFYNFTTLPNSALNTLKDKGRIDAVVTSARVDKESNTAVLRLTKIPKKANGEVLEGISPTYWVAEIKYSIKSKQSHKERELNPFGYSVDSYTLVQDKTK